ncbi:branched-chain-amino-acid transaminase [bacterium]|nr:branched-chain-amino-acid transaminase [bacterium]
MTFGKGEIWYDGKFVKWSEATTHILSHVVHYGSSIFESMRCYKNDKGPVIFRLKAHINRLYESAKIYRIEIPFSKETFTKAVIETVQKNNLRECYIRPFVFRGYGNMGLNPLKNPVCCAIAAWEWGEYLGEGVREKGVSVRVSSWRRPAPDTFPALAKAGGNYLNSQLIKMEAVQDGFDEGIALDAHGYVSEGSGENIFMVKNGVIYTPPTSASILAGITRHSIFVIARNLNIRVEQHLIPREALYLADEVFFTGTAVEITPVVKIDNIPIDKGKRGTTTKKLQDEFFGIIQGKIPDSQQWLTYL